MEVTSYALRPGAPAPPFALPATDGTTVALDDMKDAPALVVAFWCNHCPYVRAWEPRFVAWAREALERGVAVVAISSNDVAAYPQDSFDNMRARAVEQGYGFPYLFDETQDVARAYGAAVTPHFFVFGPDRRLVYQGAFDDNKEDPASVKRAYVPDAVRAALVGARAPVAEAPAKGCSVKWRRA